MSTLTHGGTPSSGAGGCGNPSTTITPLTNFNGTFTFLGGQGEALDANGQPIPGTSVALTALQVYQLTLATPAGGLYPPRRSARPAAARRFSPLNAGTPLTRVIAVRYRPLRQR